MQSVEPGVIGYVRRTLSCLTALAIRKLTVLGRRLGNPALATVPVSAAILTRVPTVSSEQPLEDVAQLFVGGRNAEVPVIDHGHPVGVVTRDDVALGLEHGGPHTAVADVPKHDVVMVSPSDSLADVLDELRAAPDRVAVVIDRGEPVGLLTFEKLAAYVAASRTLA